MNLKINYPSRQIITNKSKGEIDNIIESHVELFSSDPFFTPYYISSKPFYGYKDNNCVYYVYAKSPIANAAKVNMVIDVRDDISGSCCINIEFRRNRMYAYSLYSSKFIKSISLIFILLIALGNVYHSSIGYISYASTTISIVFMICSYILLYFTTSGMLKLMRWLADKEINILNTLLDKLPIGIESSVT